MALVLNISLFSCNSDTVTETDSLYGTQATEGEDGKMDDEDPDA